MVRMHNVNVCMVVLSDPTNRIYLQNIDEGGNPRNIALKELSKRYQNHLCPQGWSHF